MLLNVFLELIGVIAIILYQMGNMHSVYIEYVKQIDKVSTYSNNKFYEYILKSYYNKLPDNDNFEETLGIKDNGCGLNEDGSINLSFDNNNNGTIDDEIDGCVLNIKKNEALEPFYEGTIKGLGDNNLYNGAIVPNTFITIKKNSGNYEVVIFKRIRTTYEQIGSFDINKQ